VLNGETFPFGVRLEQVLIQCLSSVRGKSLHLTCDQEPTASCQEDFVNRGSAQEAPRPHQQVSSPGAVCGEDGGRKRAGDSGMAAWSPCADVKSL
jgi:hypothetical protein